MTGAPMQRWMGGVNDCTRAPRRLESFSEAKRAVPFRIWRHCTSGRRRVGPQAAQLAQLAL